MQPATARPLAGKDQVRKTQFAHQALAVTVVLADKLGKAAARLALGITRDFQTGGVVGDFSADLALETGAAMEKQGIHGMSPWRGAHDKTAGEPLTRTSGQVQSKPVDSVATQPGALLMPSKDSLNCRRSLEVSGQTYHYFSLPEAAKSLGDISRLPLSLKVLLENLLRWEDGTTVQAEDSQAIADWLQRRCSDHEIGYRPARVLMQDFTGVPAIVDLAAMRDAMAKAGADPQRINPLTPVDLVIDHSVMVDRFADPSAFADNVAIEMQRNAERYAFLRWGQQAFANFRVVPPGTGICHQVNLEYLAQVVWTR